MTPSSPLLPHRPKRKQRSRRFGKIRRRFHQGAICAQAHHAPYPWIAQGAIRSIALELIVFSVSGSLAMLVAEVISHIREKGAIQ